MSVPQCDPETFGAMEPEEIAYHSTPHGAPMRKFNPNLLPTSIEGLMTMPMPVTPVPAPAGIAVPQQSVLQPSAAPAPVPLPAPTRALAPASVQAPVDPEILAVRDKYQDFLPNEWLDLTGDPDVSAGNTMGLFGLWDGMESVWDGIKLDPYIEYNHTARSKTEYLPASEPAEETTMVKYFGRFDLPLPDPLSPPNTPFDLPLASPYDETEPAPSAPFVPATPPPVETTPTPPSSGQKRGRDDDEDVPAKVEPSAGETEPAAKRVKA
ncbi:hypothetical protein DFJ77DRAFT_480515 [Powellomyces hirtus]|nr:hypothetical protein DFJ77DRAFT_480515 [Powellomyces hirtus]